MEAWELTARERIRDSMANYNWSGDAFRLDELARTFAEDGALEIRGEEPLQGRETIVQVLASLTGGKARIVRHNVTNIRFLEVTPEHARVAAYFTVFTDIGLDHYGRYRDTFVPVGDEWLIKHRFVSTDWRSPESTMARAVKMT
jgi:hypothetical protein